MNFNMTLSFKMTLQKKQCKIKKCSRISGQQSSGEFRTQSNI